MRHMVFGLIAALLLFSEGASAESYDFKGTRLGVSLGDFRQAPHPDGNQSARVVCSGDAAASRYAYLTDYGPERQLQIVRCAFLTDRPDPIGRYSAPITVGGSGYGSINHLYSFTKDATGTYRLFEISLTAHVGALSDVLGALEAKFGNSEVTEGTAQNGAGASFARAKHLWSNESSTVEVETPFGRIDEFRVFYSHRELSQQVAAGLETLKGPVGNRM